MQYDIIFAFLHNSTLSGSEVFVLRHREGGEPRYQGLTVLCMSMMFRSRLGDDLFAISAFKPLLTATSATIFATAKTQHTF